MTTPEPTCVFCSILTGEIPSTRVREDENTVAFLDINPAAPVHVLVVPREHYPNLQLGQLQAPDLMSKLLSAAVAVAEDRGVADGWRLIFNSGARAGQTVFHVHAHVLGWPGEQT